MLSEEEKRELLEMAASPELRRDFELLEKFRASKKITLETYIGFLSQMSRFNPKIARHSPPITGHRFLL